MNTWKSVWVVDFLVRLILTWWASAPWFKNKCLLFSVLEWLTNSLNVQFWSMDCDWRLSAKTFSTSPVSLVSFVSCCSLFSSAVFFFVSCCSSSSLAAYLNNWKNHVASLLFKIIWPIRARLIMKLGFDLLLLSFVPIFGEKKRLLQTFTFYMRTFTFHRQEFTTLFISWKGISNINIKRQNKQTKNIWGLRGNI